jgi:broad specificity phosphatase PhoE
VILIRHGQTEFNRVFSVTRRDPGIRDPQLTLHGRAQAAAVAAALQPLGIKKLIASPYARALETASIIASSLGVTITIDMLIAERFCFACDIGSPSTELRARWPDLIYDHLPDPWWPQTEETEAAIAERSERFCCGIAGEDWTGIALVTHWGFIRSLTGLKVPNGAVLRIDPTRREHPAEMLFVPPQEDPPSAPLMPLHDP